jgi:hypothetical protein
MPWLVATTSDLAGKRPQIDAGFMPYSRNVPRKERRRTKHPPFWSKISRVRLPLRDGEIRVLTLHAGDVPDLVKCSLQVVLLDEKPVYEALSYTWGDPDTTEAIHVNGTRVDVTVNLENALR